MKIDIYRYYVNNLENLNLNNKNLTLKSNFI